VSGIGRSDVIAYLRWLADQPGVIPHRQWLFHAALMLDRDVSTRFVPMKSSTSMERHGDQAI
jgi:hypothetical protein